LWWADLSGKFSARSQETLLAGVKHTLSGTIKVGTVVDTFALNNSAYIELNDLLKVTGLCASGGEAKARIAQGQVQVDGQVELRKRCKIRKAQRVAFAGHEIDVV
jgi:ribosome-associated protein